jgi:hypothetical protein
MARFEPACELREGASRRVEAGFGDETNTCNRHGFYGLACPVP